MTRPTYADHLRAATAAIAEVDDRLGAAYLEARADVRDEPELKFARELTRQVNALLGTLRRRAVREDPVDRAGDELPDEAGG